MELSTAKRKLAILWFIFSAVLFLLILLQTLLGKYEDKVGDVWGWLFPNILPTLSLMVAIFLYDINSAISKSKIIDKFYFRLTFYISVFYLSILIFIIVFEPFILSPILSVLENSNFYLGPLQGVVAATIGLLFVRGE